MKIPELEDPVEEMIRISRSPILIPRMPFGKHKGELFGDVSPDHLQWLLTRELDEEMGYTVKQRLEWVLGE